MAVNGIDGVPDIQAAVLTLTTHIRVPAVQCQQDLRIVPPRLYFWFNVEESELPRLRGAFQIATGMNVAVIPASPGRTRHERISPNSARRHHWCPFLLGTIYLRRNEQTVPMNELGNLGVIEYVHGDGLTLAQPQDRAGSRAFVSGRLDRFPPGDFHVDGEMRIVASALELSGTTCQSMRRTNSV